MKAIGIIAAMEEEMSAVKAKMTHIKTMSIYEKTFFTGFLSGKQCVLVECGIGKVNAARTTQLIIDHFSLICIINVGSAGALNYNLDYLDIVISTACVQFDFDLTVFGRKQGELPELGCYLTADTSLVSLMEKAIRLTDSKHRIFSGIIATGDQFINDPEIKQTMHEQFHAECDEMEGAAVAQVCTLCHLPFVIIRSITDKPNSKEKVDFYEYLDEASARCACFLEQAAILISTE
ncbi:MAG: 5'-methylthioadenosine/adenosylhomocysteine nucleosidase [Clostridiales bacterium]|nr:5'-methylthioadenosine/adenosylhomocysteine nucleosidase [Clostridiales bacterium]